MGDDSGNITQDQSSKLQPQVDQPPAPATSQQATEAPAEQPTPVADGTGQTPTPPVTELSSKIPVDEAPPVTTDNTKGPGSSKKSAVLAIFAVLIAAAAIAGGTYWYLNFKNKPLPEEITTRVEPPKASLVITAPQDQTATTSAQIRIEGKTNPNSLVAVYGENNQETFEGDENGNFSGTLTLDEGPNEITFVVFDDKTEEQSETRSVVYVKEEELK